MDTPWSHTTVMLREAVEALVARPDGIYVDATFGRGGHSRAILERLDARGRLITFDKDPQAVQAASAITDPRFSIRHEAFTGMSSLADGSIAGVLLDLGVSSPQIDDPARGFSFRSDGPLDMRMDTTRGESVADWLAHATSWQIEEVIRDFGEERFAGRIAAAIDARRADGRPLVTTAELARLVASAVRTREPGQDPATRTFQAFRIFINAELEELERALGQAVRVLETSGRLVAISFHSLEDRIVKRFITERSRDAYDRRAPFAAPRALPLEALGRSKPSPEEVARNPRSRSAVMRVARRTDVAAGGAGAAA